LAKKKTKKKQPEKVAFTQRWKDRWAKNKKSYMFIISILVFGIFSFWLTSQEFFDVLAQPLLNLYANISNWILLILGQGTRASSESIFSSDFSIQIKKGCDAIAPMILYTLSILFFPVKWKHKPKGILIGILLLFALNILRIVTLFLTGKYIPSIFDMMHTDIWQILFIVFTLYLWLIWLRKVNAEEENLITDG
jgi:exosortase/archaeosortase family protein